MCHNNYKAGKCTNHNGIQKNSQRGQNPLLTGMLGICCRSRHGNRSLTSLIRHQATLHTLRHNSSHCPAEKCLRLKCSAKHCRKEIRNPSNVEDDQYKYYRNIQHCHNRYHHIRPFGYLFDSSKSYSRCQNHDSRTCNIIKQGIHQNCFSCKNLSHSSYRRNYIKSLCRQTA